MDIILRLGKKHVPPQWSWKRIYLIDWVVCVPILLMPLLWLIAGTSSHKFLKWSWITVTVKQTFVLMPLPKWGRGFLLFLCFFLPLSWIYLMFIYWTFMAFIILGCALTSCFSSFLVFNEVPSYPQKKEKKNDS